MIQDYGLSSIARTRSSLQRATHFQPGIPILSEMDGLGGEGEAGLLTIPIELRLVIYRFIFQGVRVSLLCDPTILQEDEEEGDDDNIAREPDAEQGRHRRFQLSLRSETAPGLISNNDLSILLVCHKTHDEARSVFFQMVTFYLRSLVDPTIVGSARASLLQEAYPRSADPSTGPLPLPLPRAINARRQMAAIQHLSIAHSLLSSFTPNKLHHVFPSLSHLQIHHITIPLAHQTLSSLTPHLYTLHRATSLSLSNGESSSSSSSSIPSHDMEHHSPGLLLFQTLLCAMDDEAQMEAIMAHASFAAGPDRYALELQFVLKCRHVGMLVVPGMFPMANAPHRHAERDVTYTFNAGGGGGGGGNGLTRR